MLDTNQVIELAEIEAVNRIEARIAVEAPMQNAPVPPPESAVLDRARETMTKPRPQPRTAPIREKRRKKR